MSASAGFHECSGTDVGDPYFLFRARRIGRGVGNILIGIRRAASYVGNPTSVRREFRLGDFLPVVFVVAGQLPAFERGRFGYPDVALAFGVEYPSDLVAVLRSDQVGRKRRAQDLLEGETVAPRQRRT